MNGVTPDREQIERMETAADWLQRLQSSPRDEALAIQWFDWCQAAPENLAAFEHIQAIWQAFDAADLHPLSVARDSNPLSRSQAGASFSKWALAAGLALLAAVAWWGFNRSQTTAILTTDVAEHGSQILADGSHVDLGAQTRIATHYSSAERAIVVERGEAFFEVVKDAKRPFVVQAGAVRVTALGTAFSVRRSLDRTVVTVSEGLVSVAPQSATWPVSPGNRHELRAGAGERVTFTAEDNRLSVASVDPRSAAAWRQGVLKFVDEPLAAVIDDVNRYALHPIRLEDARLRTRLYTGTVYRDRIDDWLQALERVFPIQTTTDSTGAVILNPK